MYLCVEMYTEAQMPGEAEEGTETLRVGVTGI